MFFVNNFMDLMKCFFIDNTTITFDITQWLNIFITIIIAQVILLTIFLAISIVVLYQYNKNKKKARIIENQVFDLLQKVNEIQILVKNFRLTSYEQYEELQSNLNVISNTLINFVDTTLENNLISAKNQLNVTNKFNTSLSTNEVEDFIIDLLNVYRDIGNYDFVSINQIKKRLQKYKNFNQLIQTARSTYPDLIRIEKDNLGQNVLKIKG